MSNPKDMTALTRERRSYALWTQDRVRYGDTDRQGHVNNAVYATYFETGRMSLLPEDYSELVLPGTSMVVARLEIDFHAELFYPGQVDIGTRILAVGRTSFRFGQAVFKGELCAATAVTVSVLVDGSTRKPTPLGPQLRAWLEARLPA